MAEAFIRFEGVGFRYPNGVKALEHLSFAVGEGEAVAVVGANGSGKSTLARLCNGLLIPTEGTVTVASVTIDPGSPGRSGREELQAVLADLRRQVAMVFQHPDNQLVAATVEEDVAFGPENFALPAPIIRQRVSDALAAVGLEALRNRAPHELSGGQKQLVAIAGALALEPRCLILDEATAMLDPQSARAVMETVARLRRERGLTVLFITHRMEELAWADRVLALREGRLVADLPPAELFARGRQLSAWGLEPPDTVRLAESLRERGWALPPVRGGVDELVEAIWRYACRG